MSRNNRVTREARENIYNTWARYARDNINNREASENRNSGIIYYMHSYYYYTYNFIVISG